MEKNTWKTIALVFCILFVVETFILVWSVVVITIDNNKLMECLYDICEEYPDAYYEYNICSCYDYDALGQLIVVKEKYLP